MTTARNRAIDRLGRDRTLAAKTPLLALPEAVEKDVDDKTIPDERLELVFTDLDGYQYFHSTRAELLRRLGQLDEATTAYGGAPRARLRRA